MSEEKSREIKASLEAMIAAAVRSQVSARDRLERQFHHNRVPDPALEVEYLASRFLNGLASSVQPLPDQDWEDALFGAIYACEERLRQLTDLNGVKGPVQRAQDEIEVSVIVNFMAFARRFQ